MHPQYSHVVLTVGLLLAVALACGGLAELVRLPKVTVYLLIGLLLGPAALGWVPEEHLGLLQPLTKMAIALVLFNLGCQFPLSRARQLLRRVAGLSLGELLLTFLLVAMGMLLLGLSWKIALLLGCLALATAPATTILVLKETESEGTVTDYAQALVAVNNLVAIVAFELVFAAIEFARGGQGPSPAARVGQLAAELAGSLVLGLAAGLVISMCFGLVAPGRRLALLVGVATLTLGICESLHLPYLLAFLVMGLTTVNSSTYGRPVVAELDRWTGLLAVLFFATSGVELDLAGLIKVGWVGVAYIILRSAGKYGGIWLAADWQREPAAVRRWLGAAMIAQAGAAISLAAIAVRRDPELGGFVQPIILGTVAFFEIVGPICIRQAVIRAGEVPLAYAIPHAGIDLLDQLRGVWNRLLLSFGYDPWQHRSPDDLSVQHIMRANVQTLSHKYTFDDVLAFIEHSRDSTYPVVGGAGELVGMIRYRELSQTLVDREVGPLVLAVDVMTPPGKILYPDEPISKVSQVFKGSKDDCLPVVSREQPERLLGVVRRRDILRLLIRRQSNTP